MFSITSGGAASEQNAPQVQEFSITLQHGPLTVEEQEKNFLESKKLQSDK